MEEKVKDILEKVRPQLQADGGDLEFIKLDGNTVTVRLQGACQGCPGAQMTLKMGIERLLKKHVDENLEVVPG
ncbi:MAG TPA: NifU family protein [bacterium]|nr:NifU family protein [bacterium]